MVMPTPWETLGDRVIEAAEEAILSPDSASIASYSEPEPMTLFDLTNHVAIVTGANHGIGAATARILSECGARVLVAYLRLEDAGGPGIPETYRRSRASGAEHVHRRGFAETGGQATAVQRLISLTRTRLVACSTPPRLTWARSISWSTTHQAGSRTRSLAATRDPAWVGALPESLPRPSSSSLR